MALEEALNEILGARKTNKLSPFCAYQSLYQSLSKADQSTIDKAWANNYPVNLIVQALRKDGHKTSSDAVRAHQNGTCRCPKD